MADSSGRVRSAVVYQSSNKKWYVRCDACQIITAGADTQQVAEAEAERHERKAHV